MAVLAVVKEGAGTLFRKAADGAGNLVAKASSLSSVQIQAMSDAREKYLRESRKPIRSLSNGGLAPMLSKLTKHI